MEKEYLSSKDYLDRKDKKKKVHLEFIHVATSLHA